MRTIPIENILQDLQFVDPELSSFIGTEELRLSADELQRAEELLDRARRAGASVSFDSEISSGTLIWRSVYFAGPTTVLLALLRGLQECTGGPGL